MVGLVACCSKTLSATYFYLCTWLFKLVLLYIVNITWNMVYGPPWLGVAQMLYIPLDYYMTLVSRLWSGK